MIVSLPAPAVQPATGASELAAASAARSEHWPPVSVSAVVVTEIVAAPAVAEAIASRQPATTTATNTRSTRPLCQRLPGPPSITPRHSPLTAAGWQILDAL